MAAQTAEFTAEQWRWLRAAAVEAILARRRRREFVPLALQEAVASIDAAAPTCAISASGNVRNVTAPQSKSMITTSEVAALLGCSPRRVRQLAPQLGGQQLGRSWIFDRDAIGEHADGRD
jgi:hypothetical protein